MWMPTGLAASWCKPLLVKETGNKKTQSHHKNEQVQSKFVSSERKTWKIDEHDRMETQATYHV